jgi:type III pantothenate kinase
MKPDIVVDVGNTRVKWGLCTGRDIAAAATLVHDEPAAWQEQLDTWGFRAGVRWAVSGVHPTTRDRLIEWTRLRGDPVLHVELAAQLPLQVRLEHPDRVGIDRLLDAVAVNSRREPRRAAVAVDAGSAVTVDCIDATGTFRGGAIFPGLRLMARALREHTALLPLVEIATPLPPVPGMSTTAAIEAGVYWAVVGGIEALARRSAGEGGPSPEIFLTGGDAPLLRPGLGANVIHWPTMTLEGIRLAAESLP